MANISTLITSNSVPGYQKFTSSGTFTVPANVYTLIVTMCGGGGGRFVDSYSGSTGWGGGGSGGYIISRPLAVTPGTTLTITVGAAGTSRVRTGVSTYYGTETNGGTSEILLNSTSLLKTTGGSYGTSTTNAGSQYSVGGAGGSPNGSGGGAYSNNTSSFYEAGATSSTTGGQGGGSVTNSVSLNAPGFGVIKTCEGGKTPIPGYGSGTGRSDTLNNITQTSGQPGVVILTWAAGGLV